jgi:LuxR family maltose regulon positive regulatory protein
MDSFSPWGRRYAAAHRAKLDLLRGDMNAAERWAEANDLVLDDDFEFHREGEYLTLTRLLIAQRHFEQAHTLAERIRRIAQSTGKRHTELEALILLALIFSTQDETDQALFHLERAVAIAEPEGFIRVFVDEGQPMTRLLNTALKQGSAPGYVGRLLAAFSGDQPLPAAPVTMQTDQSDLVEPLSERELEVLHHIAEGLTNLEVADRLFLSLNTVKAHTRNIYGKLDVHNRTQAVARARELGLLPGWPAQ